MIYCNNNNQVDIERRGRGRGRGHLHTYMHVGPRDDKNKPLKFPAHSISCRFVEQVDNDDG